MGQLISETFDSTYVCLYAIVGLVREFVPSFGSRCQIGKLSNQQMHQSNVKRVSVWWVTRSREQHLPVIITDKTLRLELREPCRIFLQSVFQRFGVDGNEKKLFQNICSFVDE